MNRWSLGFGATIILIGLGIYLSEYYALSRCTLVWCQTGFQLHPEVLLLVPLGLAVIGYSFRHRGGTIGEKQIGAQLVASRVLPIVVVIAIMIGVILSVDGTAFFAEASQVAAGSVCAIELPSGSTVNPSAGTITLPNGSADAITKFPCSMTSVIWATGRSAIGKYLPFTLIVIATMALLHFVAVRSN